MSIRRFTIIYSKADNTASSNSSDYNTKLKKGRYEIAILSYSTGQTDALAGTQKQVLAAAAGRARDLCLSKPLLARGAYPEAAKPLSAANGVGWRYDLPEP
jgi:hypothetical protein